MIPTASPRRILKLAPSRTVFFPKDFFTPRSSMRTSASSSASSSAAPAERVGESAIARGGRRGTRRDLEAAVPRVESSAPKRRPRLGSGDVPPPLVSFPSPKRGAAGAARPTAARAACIAPTTETHRSPRLSPGMTCACRRARGEWRAGDAPRGRGTKSDWIFAVHGRDELSFPLAYGSAVSNKSHHHRALDRSRRPMDAFQSRVVTYKAHNSPSRTAERRAPAGGSSRGAPRRGAAGTRTCHVIGRDPHPVAT